MENKGRTRTLSELKELTIAEIIYQKRKIRVFLPKNPTPEAVIEIEVYEETRFGPPMVKYTATFQPTSKNQNEWVGEAFVEILKQLPPLYKDEEK
jgi:hypothetical protein